MQPPNDPSSSTIHAFPQSRASKNVHFCRLMAALLNAQTRAVKAHTYARLAVDAIRSDLRSLVPRIRYTRFHKLDQFLRFGKMVEVQPDQTLAPNKRTHARIRDTQLLQKNLPWVTAVDCHLYLEGWNRGYEFARECHTSDSCIQSTETHLASPPVASPSARESYDCDLERGHIHISSVTPAAPAGVQDKLK
jgi:hypothetical protein